MKHYYKCPVGIKNLAHLQTAFWAANHSSIFDTCQSRTPLSVWDKNFAIYGQGSNMECPVGI